MAFPGASDTAAMVEQAQAARLPVWSPAADVATPKSSPTEAPRPSKPAYVVVREEQEARKRALLQGGAAREALHQAMRKAGLKP